MSKENVNAPPVKIRSGAYQVDTGSDSTLLYILHYCNRFCSLRTRDSPHVNIARAKSAILRHPVSKWRGMLTNWTRAVIQQSPGTKSPHHTTPHHERGSTTDRVVPVLRRGHHQTGRPSLPAGQTPDSRLQTSPPVGQAPADGTGDSNRRTARDCSLCLTVSIC